MDINQTPPEGPKVILSWQAPTIPKHNRTVWWYVVSGVIALGIAVYSFIVRAWSVGLIAPLCWLMYLLIAEHEPPQHAVSITDAGILFDQSFTRYDDLQGFWILQTPHYTELHMVKQKRRGELIIQTGNEDLQRLRIALGTYMSELTDRRESLLDRLSRYLKL